ncbi:Protein of uncharacterised function (DUF3375) [Mycobacteroides abscessus subsp. bolletii]|uniref:DUF3375 family protein n=1 Tax=Mycobacteroides abscessus TaxID=36809 RepID=UPI0009A81DC6|nr:DUF3375 family protein [Mycobacteroides abscessus]SKY53405.1 Protein of uncharacterised function (DUF3375) [Mycobacteroides abscessus subsp. bolletii]
MKPIAELIVDHNTLVDVTREHAAVTLLRLEHPAVLITVLDNTFAPDREAIPADEFEGDVETVLRTLHQAGIATPRTREVDGGSATVQALCRSWVDGGWLWKTPDGEAGTPVYSRTAETHESLEWLRQLTTARRDTGARQVGVLIEQMEDMAAKVSGDRDRQLARIRAEIAALQERELRILDGEEAGITLDDFQHWYDNIRALQRRIRLGIVYAAQQLPKERRKFLDEIAADEMDGITHIHAYDEAWRRVLDNSQGRAAREASDILSDTELRLKFGRNTDAIINSEQAEVLLANEIRELRDYPVGLYNQFAPLLTVFTDNLEDAADAFRRRTESLARGGWTDALRRAWKALRDNASRTLPIDALPEPANADIGAAPASPIVRAVAEDTPPLDNGDVSNAAPMNLEYLARWGEPHPREIEAHISCALADVDDGVTISLADVWADAPHNLRRWVELFPYFAYATRHGDDGSIHEHVGRRVTIETTGPEGEVIACEVPAISFIKLMDTQQ